jgi:2-methylcitrate dehydratase PrpD
MTQIEAVARGKPEPVISGPSQVDGIARFALRAKYDDLTAERRERLKVSILDAVACAINALGAPPIEACRAQADELGGPGGRCTLVGGGRANPVYAAFYNSALIRYVDFMDSYLARGGLCHPSDNTRAILAAGEHADLSGKDFLTALAVAYQVEAQLTASVPFMAHGFDLTTTQLSYSLAAGLSKALGLDDQNTAAALGICGDFIPLLVARTTLGVARRDGPEVRRRRNGWLGSSTRGADPNRLGLHEARRLRPAGPEELQHRGSWPGVDPLHARAA